MSDKTDDNKVDREGGCSCDKENPNSSCYLIEETDLKINKLSNGLIRVPLARIGEWKHDNYGVVKFSQQDFENIKANHEKNVLGFESYLTYGHPKEDDNPQVKADYLEQAKSFDAERKRGDLQNIVIDGEVLYGDYQPSVETLASIENEEFDYSSGEFVRDFTDKNTGENIGTVLVRTALTNAPFIPLGEKIRILSHNYQPLDKKDLKKDSLNPHSTTSFIIKLSTEPINKKTVVKEEENSESLPANSEVDLSNLNKKEKPLTTNTTLNPETVTDQGKEAKEVAAPAAAPAAETKVAAEAVAPVKETKEAVAPANSSEKSSTLNFNLEDVVKQVTAQVSQDFNKAKNAYETTIKTLENNVTALTNSLKQQQQLTTKFSQNLSSQAKVAKAQQLADKGVSPALIQRFSLLADSISPQESSKVIKLSSSVDGVEKVVDSNVLNEIESLLVDAVNYTPVNVEKFGQSNASQTLAETNLQNIIKANQAKAQKLSAK